MTTKPCSLHGVSKCPTCDKLPGECDFGACTGPAVSVYARFVAGRLAEKRGLCAKHFETCRQLDAATLPSSIMSKAVT